MWKYRLDDLESGNVGGCVHAHEDGGVAEELLDAEVERHAVAGRRRSQGQERLSRLSGLPPAPILAKKPPLKVDGGHAQ